MQAPLAGLRVVELSERPAGWYAGEMFARFGANVVAVRRPGFTVPMRCQRQLPGGHPA